MTPGILREGHSCWCRGRARRMAMLVDGEAYFRALADAIERAERSIVMLGWDFHSQVRMRREGEDGGAGSELVALLERQVRRERRLKVSILAWDFAMIYALEREWLPLVRFGLSTHRRIRFRFDDQHPLGASHHQKVVVIDGVLAFSGGLDVTACRWDTSEHAAADPRRSDPGFPDYGPFHDVQAVVDGDAAAALAELAQERWQGATGKRLALARTGADLWPRGLVPDLRDVDVAISRTLPAWEGRDEVREVEKLYLESVRAARHCIYLENQYFTSHVLGDALAARLAEPDGPEVVVVVPAVLSGWLEEQTMGVLTARIGRQLREADRGGRLRLLRPRLPGDAKLTIHSKIAVIDDRLLRIGSANLSNRSMGFDSECDLSIESTPERDVSREIRGLRDGLVAEHLGLEAEEVGRAVEREGSLGAAIDALSAGERRLEPVEPEAEAWTEPLVADGSVFDPERPVAAEALPGLFSSGRDDAGGADPWPRLQLGIGLALVVALWATWTWTPVSELLTPEGLAQRVGSLGDSVPGGLLAVGLFAVAATLLVPVVVLIATCGVLFGFGAGSSIALGGSVLAAGLGYLLGRVLWRDAVRRLSGKRIAAVSRRLAEQGVLATAALRIVPVAPFGVINLVAGASHIRIQDFLIGTALGMGPGTLALVFFGDRALAALREPTPTSVGAALAVLALVALASFFVQRRLGED